MLEGQTLYVLRANVRVKKHSGRKGWAWRWIVAKDRWGTSRMSVEGTHWYDTRDDAVEAAKRKLLIWDAARRLGRVG